jgi:hypothetical protein
LELNAKSTYYWQYEFRLPYMMGIPMERLIRAICMSIIYLVFSALFSPSVFATDMPEIAIPLISEKIQVDGLLREQAWQTKSSIGEFIQVEPRSGASPTEQTKVWLTYNEDSFFVAVRCEDQHPKQIVATEMSRDAMLMDMEAGINDSIEFIIDTYHDHRNAYYFATNSAGALVDGRITENQSPALEWDGIWNVRTHTDDAGWTAEFEIPFKTIGFNPNLRTWGFNISRYLARGRETSRWASPSLDVKINHVVKAGSVTGLEDLSQGVGLDIKPYGIFGFTRDINRKDELQWDPDAGGDIFYRLTSNLVSSTTINTDFAETEVDTRQVNLTRFPLFFPEKRSFFLEDAGIFEFAKQESHGPPGMDMGGDFIPFFSRRIGLVEGHEIPIRVGQKLTGKIGRFDIGLLDVQTGRFTEDEKANGEDDLLRLASKNLAVGRIKTNFLNQSYVGGMFTNGDPKRATSNFLNRQKNLNLLLFGSKTYITNIKNGDALYGGIISYPNDFVEAEYKWITIEENYYPAMGFVPRNGIRISSFNTEVSPRPDFWNIRQMSFEFSYEDYYKLDKGTWESKKMEINPFRWQFNSGDFVDYEWTWYREQLFDPWPISDRNGIILPTGQYSYNSHTFRFMTSPSRPFSLRSDFIIGSFYSGTIRSYVGEITWRKDRHLTTSLELQQNWIRLKEGNFNTSLVMYRLDYSFTPFITLANFLQYDTDSRNIGLQSRLRWILHPGNDFFIVLNHSWQEDSLDRFVSAQTRFRVKLNYTFRF